MRIEDILNIPMSMVRSEGELKHYASEYYDPVKAHEYYMEHRKLKGRDSAGDNESESSSSSSSDTSGGSAEATKSEGDSNKTSFEEEYERYMFQANKKITALRNRLSGLSKEARMLLKDEIEGEIDKLREENMNKKYELKAKYGKGSGSGSGSKGAQSDRTAAAYKAKWG